jgi:hypothetical protein
MVLAGKSWHFFAKNFAVNQKTGAAEEGKKPRA